MSRGILALDTSALVRRYVADRDRPLVISAMAGADQWVASAAARAEVMLALHAAATDPESQRQAWTAVRDDWESLWEVPVDARCLAAATDIGARYGIGLLPSIHLAAAQRLPGRIRFLTFDRRQIPAAAALGFELISPDG
ncbi:MAG: type II toxin-antitoxin system VapC family toxin [Acidimicrobiales bacterium]